MTVATGGRPSRRVKAGSAVAAAVSTEGPLPVSSGGTGASTSGEARANLDVPGLGDDNVFSGVNEFGAAVSFQNTVTCDADLNVTTGSLNATGDPCTINSLDTSSLTVNGVDVLTDAPSDGKYYVRKDGAWVEIIP